MWFLLWTAPSTKFLLEAKVKNIASWNVSNLGVWRGFLDTQICQKYRFQIVCSKLEIKMCLVNAAEIELPTTMFVNDLNDWAVL